MKGRRALVQDGREATSTTACNEIAGKEKIQIELCARQCNRWFKLQWFTSNTPNDKRYG